jgi:hypothetical protein
MQRDRTDHQSGAVLVASHGPDAGEISDKQRGAPHFAHPVSALLAVLFDT